MELPDLDIEDLIYLPSFSEDPFPNLNLNNPNIIDEDTENLPDLFEDDDVILNDLLDTSSNNGVPAVDLQHPSIDSLTNLICNSSFELRTENQNDSTQIPDSNQQENQPENFPVARNPNQGNNFPLLVICQNLFGDLTGAMSIIQQPKANKRLRYTSDGARFLPDRRYNPLSTELPQFLKDIQLKKNQILGVVLTLTTVIGDNNSEVYLHANDLAYRVNGAVKVGYASVFVPFDAHEIHNAKKKFDRLSIIYKKCDEYSFDLIPFSTQTMFGMAQKYNSSNKRSVGVAAIGKDFKHDYDLLSYRIVFQLALLQDNVVYISNISCQTEDIHEKAAQGTKGGSNKRKSSVSLELDSEDSDTSSSTVSKRSRNNDGLPITRT